MEVSGENYKCVNAGTIIGDMTCGRLIETESYYVLQFKISENLCLKVKKRNCLMKYTDCLIDTNVVK